MRTHSVVAITLVLVLIAGSALAYGPSIHMREADFFVTQCELNPTAGLQHNSDYLRRFRSDLLLGSIWPDIGRVITVNLLAGKVDENLYDPHNRHFVQWMLDESLAAYPENPWRVAFAVGNHMHCAGDAVAQDMLTQHLAVRWALGEMDIVTGTMDAHPGGENEAFVEGGLEFMHPALDIYWAMVEDFVLSPEGLVHLLAIVDDYLTAYAEYFAVDLPLSADAATEIVAEILTSYPLGFPPCARNADPVVLNWARSGFDTDALAAAKGFDTDELLRVIGNGVLGRENWDNYYDEGFFGLPPTMMLDFAAGQPFFDEFPNWSAAPMKSSVIQSLASYLPDQFAVEDGRFVMSLNWYENDALIPITSIDAASPPATLTLEVVLFDTLGRTRDDPSIILRVRDDSPDAVVSAQREFDDVTVDPWTYNQHGMVRLQLEIEPTGAIERGATGLVADLIPGDQTDGLPFLTTDWAAYALIDEIDMTKDAYTLQYSSYNHWPYSLRIVYDGAAAVEGGAP